MEKGILRKMKETKICNKWQLRIYANRPWWKDELQDKNAQWGVSQISHIQVQAIKLSQARTVIQYFHTSSWQTTSLAIPTFCGRNGHKLFWKPIPQLTFVASLRSKHLVSRPDRGRFWVELIGTRTGTGAGWRWRSRSQAKATMCWVTAEGECFVHGFELLQSFFDPDIFWTNK